MHALCHCNKKVLQLCRLRVPIVRTKGTHACDMQRICVSLPVTMQDGLQNLYFIIACALAGSCTAWNCTFIPNHVVRTSRFT